MSDAAAAAELRVIRRGWWSGGGSVGLFGVWGGGVGLVQWLDGGAG